MFYTSFVGTSSYLTEGNLFQHSCNATMMNNRHLVTITVDKHSAKQPVSQRVLLLK